MCIIVVLLAVKDAYLIVAYNIYYIYNIYIIYIYNIYNTLYTRGTLHY